MYSDDPDFSKILENFKGDKNLQAKPSDSNGVDDLRFILMTSRVTIVNSPDEVLAMCPKYHQKSSESESRLTVGVCKADGKKCDRCWYYSESVGEDHDHPDVCPRCADAVKTDGYTV